MTIDAHQHFWIHDPIRDAWITEDMNVIRQDLMPNDLKPLLDKSKITGCVAVQADQSETETRFLLGLSDQYSYIKGVVGWLDLLSSDINLRLEYFKQFTLFKGVRHIVHAEPDGFMLDTKFINGVRAVGSKDLTYDILVRENQLEEAHAMVKRIPVMGLVIDHIGNPNIEVGHFDHWARYMKQLSQFNHVHVKLSGMVTQANHNSWTSADIRPYVDFCLEHFGPARLMFGSDWPVCLLAADYEQAYQALIDCLIELSNDERSMILGTTAIKFYNLFS